MTSRGPSPGSAIVQKSPHFRELVQNKKRSFVPSFTFGIPKKFEKEHKSTSRNGSVASMLDSRPSSSSNAAVNLSKGQQKNKAGGGGFASRMRNLVTNRNRNVTSTKVTNGKVDGSTCDISVASSSNIAKGFRRRRKRAQESQSFEMKERLGISHSDAARSVSEPSLAAQHSASNNRSRVDAFVREASSNTSLTSSSVTANSRTNKRGER